MTNIISHKKVTFYSFPHSAFICNIIYNYYFNQKEAPYRKENI